MLVWANRKLWSLRCSTPAPAPPRALVPGAQMLRLGFAVDTCDYDGRTALMLASSKVRSCCRGVPLAAPHRTTRLGLAL